MARDINSLIQNAPTLEGSQKAYLASLVRSLRRVTQNIMGRIADFRAEFPELGAGFTINAYV